MGSDNDGLKQTVTVVIGLVNIFYLAYFLYAFCSRQSVVVRAGSSHIWNRSRAAASALSFRRMLARGNVKSRVDPALAAGSSSGAAGSVAAADRLEVVRTPEAGVRGAARMVELPERGAGVH